ncbi:sigma-54 dependent transcriptional regulator [Desulfuromonas sp. AOP6]|uniref:sigma-54-dependent transcriptional regulator n=1 Tax=Desulfuromonas sp. AOP6 TaxID=1566351 RepID=UPI00127776A6|nr:sigma-54 dependent transcriptional regulator [Desulfuromonas sp. AOP6]BCA78758.1 acetoacetate metabolism regulatory protein AtoC [Desulfuromonas sp. AOP6]
MTSSLVRTLLVIDDDRILGAALKDGLSGPAQEVLLAPTAAEGLFICRRQKVDVVLLDQNLPDGLGIDLCPQILEANERCKIIFITAYPDFSYAVRAIKGGAYDYLTKPFELEELLLVVDRAFKTRALERVEDVENYRAMQESADAVIIGAQSGLAEVERLVDLAASEVSPVLITGETGTGKNVIAKAIHYRSALARAPFVSINCASLPENLMEAELFGYEKGAFTGAGSPKRGLLEVAEGGSLFLDEIGELQPHLQAKLLGALEDRVIRRLGGTASRPVAVRILAATNLDLERAMEEKRFRKDLYFRLNVLHIALPPLRDRLEDLPLLCHAFLEKVQRGRTLRLPGEELTLLRRYSWPGNVRELKNIIERAAILQQEGCIYPSRLIAEDHTSVSPQPTAGAVLRPLEAVEKEHILFALEACEGNLARTARELGIGLSTLKRKVKSYGGTI